MASSDSYVANSGQPFYICSECKTQICLADLRVFKDGNKEYVPRGNEMNVKVHGGANKKICGPWTAVDVSCPKCGEDVGYKVIAKQEGDTTVAKSGNVRLYMCSVLLVDGNNNIYENIWVPVKTLDNNLYESIWVPAKTLD